MNARSNAPIVVGVDNAMLEGQALRWAAEQAHLEGRRLKLVNASGPVPAAQPSQPSPAPAQRRPLRVRRPFRATWSNATWAPCPITGMGNHVSDVWTHGRH